MTEKKIIEGLRKKGFRITKAREEIVRLFTEIKKPLSADEILADLKGRLRHINKSTVYRELSFLQDQKIIQGIELKDGKKRYESVFLSHHHHLVCVKCSDIKDVEMGTDLKKEEERIESETNFLVQHHSLEFFGLCGRCR